MEAVKNDGKALEYASDGLKYNCDIIMEAVKTNVYALEHANGRWRDNLDVHLEIVKNHGLCWSLYASLNRGFETNYSPGHLDLTAREPYIWKKELIIEAVKRFFDDCNIIFRQGERIPNEYIAMQISL